MMIEELTQRLQVDVKQEKREYQALGDISSEQLGIGSLILYQQRLGLTLEKKLNQHKTMPPNPNLCSQSKRLS